tara:strand:+ start:7689 stop:8141 length:453 start_codon:yes stop_codon:yes gene_type:complete
MTKNLTNIPDGSCKCSVCGEEKPNSEYTFYTSRFTQDGYRLRINTNCDSCRKRISKELRDLRKELVSSNPQPEYGSSCDLCKKPVYRNWQLDHCHETGKFRGWLCKGCNTGLGGIGDSFESTLNALIYLSKFKRLKTNELTKLIEEKINE